MNALIKLSICVAIVSFIFMSLMLEYEDLFKCVTTAISVGAITGFAYEKLLWRFNPLEKTPRMDRKYNCSISYGHNKGEGRKVAEVSIRQSLFSINLGFETDEIRSDATSAQLVYRDGGFTLQYIYETHPDGEYLDKNPKQDGACRLAVTTEGVLSRAIILKGVYWTTSSTKGTIELTRVR